MERRDKAKAAAARLPDLGQVLGHVFADPELLAQALTHPSAASPARPDNQRLEFLGDRVLGLVIAQALIRAHPAEAEGVLAPRYNALVRRETLAAVAGEIDLGPHLALGRSESTGGGRRKTAILADAMEAVIAALYLDGGLAAAERFILARWAGRLADPGAAPHDAKSALQEWAQGSSLPAPRYEIVARSGPDHAPRFVVEARLGTLPPETGTAPSKKAAEQLAAARLLARLQETP